MSDSELQTHRDTWLMTDARLEKLLQDGLASPSSPLEVDWLSGMKRKLTAGLKASKQNADK